MTTPIRRPLRSRIGAAESWIEISWPRRLISSDVLDHLDDATLAQAAHDRVVERLPRRSRRRPGTLPRPAGPRASLDSQPVSSSATGIQVFDAAVGIGGDDGVADRLQRDLRLFLLLVQLDLGALAHRDVGDRAFVADDVAVLVADDARVLDAP